MSNSPSVSRQTLPPRLAYADGVVYASQGRLFALNADDGRTMREYDIHCYPTVTVAEDVIYAGVTTRNESGEFVYAYQATDVATGALVWTAPVHGRPYFAPVVTDDAVLVAIVEGTLYALDRASGRLRWRYRADGFLATEPTMADGVVYFTPVVNDPAPTFVYAIDISSGRPQWRAGLPATTHIQLAVHGESIYVVIPNKGGLLALDGHTGSRIWLQAPVAKPVSRLVATRDAVFCICERTRFDPSVWADASDDGALPDPYIRTVELVAMRATDGKLLWEQPIGVEGPITNVGEPVAREDNVFVGAGDGALYAFDTTTGERRWCYQTGGEQTSEALVVNETVYCGASDGNIYALSAAAGELRWRTFTSTDLYTVASLRVRRANQSTQPGETDS